MDRYGSSGDGWGIIIGIIIGLIILFFICRELMCWYYKINRIVILLEEQNNLLRQQLGKPIQEGTGQGAASTSPSFAIGKDIPKAEISDGLKEAIIKASDGMSPENIALKYSVSVDSVQKILNEK
jgi:hypothetical protein